MIHCLRQLAQVSRTHAPRIHAYAHTIPQKPGARLQNEDCWQRQTYAYTYPYSSLAL